MLVSLDLKALMMNKEAPVAYVFEVLTKEKQSYAHIEREMLAMMFGYT